MIQLPTLAEIMAMFIRFELLYGWTSPNPEVVQDGCRYKITASEDDWSFRDSWRDGCFAEPGWAFGHTALSYKDTDLVVVQFQGFYTEDIARCIVAPALNQTYEAGAFCGSRGMTNATNGFLYLNQVYGIGYLFGEGREYFDGSLESGYNSRDPKRIMSFGGRECVVDYTGGLPGKEVGHHRYQGGLMVPESMIRI